MVKSELRGDEEQLAVRNLEWQIIHCEKNGDLEQKSFKIVKKNKYFPDIQYLKE
ncbi:MAG: hypothetical protein ACOC44_07155 [Promethearchaeia archaeon]